MKKYLLILSLFCSGLVYSQGREMENINEDWLYLEKNNRIPQEIMNASGWQSVSLPHTWNATDPTDLDPGYRRDASWYKKTIFLESKVEDKRYQLFFEGSNITTEVYVNGEKAGEHIGGYLSFYVDMTGFLKAGENEILVRVDNGFDPQIIPSQKSDFFIYGGITRDVWLVMQNEAHVVDMDVSTPEVSKKNASTNVVVEVSSPAVGKTLKLELTDPAGKVVYSTQQKISSTTFTIDFDIKSPTLWHVDSPNLYTLSAYVVDNHHKLDKLECRIGFRWFEFKDYGAFYLNGERLLLRGTHRHEEHAGLGAALSNGQHWADMKSIKSMGANMVRLAHYPQDPEVYKACDELGILVWDELPWCRGGVGDEVWKTHTKRLLTEMIDQNFNHPSVIIWSLGNEIYWLPDFPEGGDTDKISEFLSELNDLSHKLDPARPTAVRKYYEGAEIVDVFSPSIWSGWYSGTYKGYSNAVEKSMKKYKHFIHAEYGGSSHVGRHTEAPITGDGELSINEWDEPINQVEVKNIAQSGDWSENYIVDLFDWHLRISETQKDFVGNLQWAYKDFGTPLRPENDIPYINQKGVVDRAGNPKDAYYVFKSYWSDEPFAYIESKTWTYRNGPEGLPREVSVYSSCENVELFQNGNSLGKHVKDIEKFPACGLSWQVTFTEGDNELIAIGIKQGVTVYDTLHVTYSFEKEEAPEELALSASRLPNGNFLVEAVAVDQNGNRCLTYEERVYFQCLSGGTTMKYLGTPTGSESIRMGNGQAAIEVVPDGSDEMVMMVLNQSFKGTYLKIPVNEGEPKQKP